MYNNELQERLNGEKGIFERVCAEQYLRKIEEERDSGAYVIVDQVGYYKKTGTVLLSGVVEALVCLGEDIDAEKTYEAYLEELRGNSLPLWLIL